MDTKRTLVVALTALCALAGPTAWAGLFDDDEARRAIVSLREQMEAQRQAVANQNGRLNRVNEENSQLRRGLLELQAQIEALRAELARLHGQNEQVLHGLDEVQRQQKDVAQGMEERLRELEPRLRKLEPSKVSLDGREFVADPAEAREFEAALAVFRRSDFPTAQAAFSDFVRRYPQSGFKPTALFWLGSAQYARRDYFEAISNFRALLAMAPAHPRAPEAMLSIANCQIELKDNPAALRTLDELVKAYPQSEAAVAAKERLARIR